MSCINKFYMNSEKIMPRPATKTEDTIFVATHIDVDLNARLERYRLERDWTKAQTLRNCVRRVLAEEEAIA